MADSAFWLGIALLVSEAALGFVAGCIVENLTGLHRGPLGELEEWRLRGSIRACEAFAAMERCARAGQ